VPILFPQSRSSLRTLIKTNGKESRNWDEQSIALKEANQNSEAKPHKEQQLGIKGTQKSDMDPTTGREVVIEDVSKDIHRYF
jgi:hypothetical protein